MRYGDAIILEKVFTSSSDSPSNGMGTRGCGGFFSDHKFAFSISKVQCQQKKKSLIYQQDSNGHFGGGCHVQEL